MKDLEGEGDVPEGVTTVYVEEESVYTFDPEYFLFTQRISE